MTPGAGGLGDMGQLMKQAQDMQRRVAKVQADLKERIEEGTAGGGMVTALVNGAQDVVSVRIDPEVVDPDDVEMLEDLVLAAIRQAMEKAREMAQAEMAKATGGLGGLPGLF
jgi:DNA-binding YbaB/EbfC family protein